MDLIMKTIKMSENQNISGMCLICFEQGKEMLSIFEKPDGVATLIRIIDDCFEYKFMRLECLPPQICNDCRNLAVTAFRFKRKCQEAYMKWIEMTQDVIGENSFEEKKTEQIHELSSLPDIEEVDFKILADYKNNFISDNSKEHDEDLLVYIKQFDVITDDEDNEPLSSLRQTGKVKNAPDTFELESENKESQIQENTSAVSSSSDQIRNIVAFKTDADKMNIVASKESKTSRKNKSHVGRCELCEKVFNNASQLQKHLKTRHQEKVHKCNICEKKFTTATYLQRHVIMHAKKRYICKECTQNFLTKEELHDHVKSEGHDKRLLCPECGLRCRTSNILMVHLRRHKGEKPYKCKFCSKGFPRSDDLRLHEKYHTGEKSHFCGVCGKGFQRKYNLKIHLRVHTGEKPYKCPHCPQAFAQGNDLKAHIRRHTGERFRCELCDAAFLQGYQIRQHKLSEHGIRDEPPTQRVAKFTSVEAQKQQILQNSNKEST